MLREAVSPIEPLVVQVIRFGTSWYRRWERWFCLDCHQHTGIEYYSVQNAVWIESGGGSGMLCIGCLEERIDRRLVPSDFTRAMVNTRLAPRSGRLMNRLTGDVAEEAESTAG